MNTTYSESTEQREVEKLIERVRRFKQVNGYSYDRMGKEIGVHWRTIYSWLAGTAKPSFMARRAIRDFFKTHK